MCTSPLQFDEIEVSCRKCDECLSTRKNTWAARAMAEKATSAQTFSVTLTYNSENQENRDASEMFTYSHIKLFMARLRRSIKADLGVSGALRFICCGEFGSDQGRVHWHIILFSDVNLLSLGEFTKFGGKRKIKADEDKISIGKKIKRLVWSMWPHGLVVIQEPDQWGMEYALKYAMKDQHGIVKAQGNMREARAEAFASGYFRMSKRPPIGQAYLEEYLCRLQSLRAVPLSLKVKVPDYKGYWYPTGVQRELMLYRIYEINEQIKNETGRNAPQFSTLLNSVVELEKEWSILKNGTVSNEDEKSEETATELKRRAQEAESRRKSRDIRKKCGGFYPCQACARGHTSDGFEAIEKAAQKAAKIFGAKNGSELDEKYRTRRKPSPYCFFREEDAIISAFKYFA